MRAACKDSPLGSAISDVLPHLWLARPLEPIGYSGVAMKAQQVCLFGLAGVGLQKLPPPPPRKQRPPQNSGRLCFRNFWNRRISRLHFLFVNEDHVFSLIWGWGWYSGVLVSVLPPAACRLQLSRPILLLASLSDKGQGLLVFSPRALQQHLYQNSSGCCFRQILEL